MLVNRNEALASSRIVSITPETVTACHEGDELSGVRYAFNDGDLDTKGGLLNPFERGLDLTAISRRLSGKLHYTKEDGARAFIYATLEEQGEFEKGRGKGRGRGTGRGK